jgi:putative redox protein
MVLLIDPRFRADDRAVGPYYAQTMAVTLHSPAPAKTGLRASARPVDGLRHEIDIDGRHRLYTDEPESLGGMDSAPTPHELLPAALAGCISTMISIYAETKGWNVDGLEVAVQYDHKSTPRRFEVEIAMPSSLSLDQLTRLAKVAETCPVTRALEAGFEFDKRIVTIP